MTVIAIAPEQSLVLWPEIAGGREGLCSPSKSVGRSLGEMSSDGLVRAMCLYRD